MLKKNQSGALDFALIAVVVAVIAVGGFVIWRMNSTDTNQASQKETETVESVEQLPNDADSLKTLEEIEQITGASEEVTIVGLVLETKDGEYVYKVILSNGKKLVVNASSGEILSEEMTDLSDDDKIPDNIKVDVTPAEAYKAAAAMSSSYIVKIEMEVEDDKVTYKIEFKDGSKVEINAVGGAVVSSEIKNESKESEDSGYDDDESSNEQEDDSSDHESEEDEEDDEEEEEEEEEYEDGEDEEEDEEENS